MNEGHFYPPDTISLDNKRHNASSTSKWINQSDNWRSGEALSSVGFPQRDDEPTSHVQSPNLCSGANKTTGQMRREPNSINITSNPAYQVTETEGEIDKFPLFFGGFFGFIGHDEKRNTKKEKIVKANTSWRTR